MATLITPSLLIRGTTVTGVTAGSGIILTVVVLPPLFLGTIVLRRGAPGEPTSGQYAVGAPRRPSSAEVTISAEFWDRILEDSRTYTLTIALDYNSNRSINDVYIEYV